MHNPGSRHAHEQVQGSGLAVLRAWGFTIRGEALKYTFIFSFKTSTAAALHSGSTGPTSLSVLSAERSVCKGADHERFAFQAHISCCTFSTGTSLQNL